MAKQVKPLLATCASQKNTIYLLAALLQISLPADTPGRAAADDSSARAHMAMSQGMEALILSASLPPAPSLYNTAFQINESLGGKVS